MKESTKITLRSVIQTNVLVYCVGSFMSWDINPADWSICTRMCLMMTSVILYVVTAVVLTLNLDKKKKKNNGIPV